jgi:hypothetical protein
MAKDLIRARKTARSLPKGLRVIVGLDDDFLRRIEDVAHASGKFSDNTAARKTNIAADQMLVAAAWACHLIGMYTEQQPTTTRGGYYVRLTELIHEVATGERKPIAETATSKVKPSADAERACVRYLHMIWNNRRPPNQPEWDSD